MVTWTAPWSGQYAFNITVTMLESGCTSGQRDGVLVTYAVTGRASNAANVTSFITTRLPLLSTSVAVGEVFYLRINRRANYICDPAGVTLTVSGPTKPPPTLSVSSPIEVPGPWDASAIMVYTPNGTVTVRLHTHRSSQSRANTTTMYIQCIHTHRNA